MLTYSTKIYLKKSVTSGDCEQLFIEWLKQSKHYRCEGLSLAEVAELAPIPNRDALYSKVLGTMLAPITSLAVALGQVVEQGGGAPAAAEAAPAEEAAPAAEAPAEEAASAPAAEAPAEAPAAE